jgi:hypothetical protein
MKGIVFLMSVAAAINSSDVVYKDPVTAKKLMMLSILLTWVAAIVIAIMFIFCGFNGYSKEDQP